MCKCNTLELNTTKVYIQGLVCIVFTVTCYYGTTCSEQGTYVSSINECCSGRVYGAPLTEELIAEGGGIQAYGEYSHRTGSGPCISW